MKASQLWIHPKLSCRVVDKKKKALGGYAYLVFAFQTRSRLKYKLKENKVFLKKKIFRSTSITLLSPFNEKCFCFQTFLMTV